MVEGEVGELGDRVEMDEGQEEVMVRPFRLS